MRYTDPITDRTATDVVNKANKAYFNVADWVRINNNTTLVAKYVQLYRSYPFAYNDEESGFFSEPGTPTITTIPTANILSPYRLVENIENTRIVLGFSTVTIPHLQTSYRVGPFGQTPNYNDINTWESAIDAMLSALTRVINYMPVCGVAKSGQLHFYQHQFRSYPYVQNAVSPVRSPRCFVASCGSGMTRNNNFRRYA